MHRRTSPCGSTCCPSPVSPCWWPSSAVTPQTGCRNPPMPSCSRLLSAPWSRSSTPTSSRVNPPTEGDERCGDGREDHDDHEQVESELDRKIDERRVEKEVRVPEDH